MDTSTAILGFTLLLLPLSFTVLGFMFKAEKAIACLVMATVFWFVMVPVFPLVISIAENLYYLGYIFILPGIVTFAFILPNAISLWRISRQEDWEKEND